MEMINTTFVLIQEQGFEDEGPHSDPLQQLNYIKLKYASTCTKRRRYSNLGAKVSPHAISHAQELHMALS